MNSGPSDEIIKILHSLNVQDEEKIEYFLNQNCLFIAEKICDSKSELKKIAALKNINKCIANNRLAALKPVFCELQKKDIAYAVIKGDILSIQIYGQIGYRRSTDIDILIEPSAISEVKKILYNSGFSTIGSSADSQQRKKEIFWTLNTHQIIPFHKVVNKQLVNVDINFDVYWGQSDTNCDMAYILNRTNDLEINGVNIRVLDKEMSFLTMCLHHFKDVSSTYLISQGSYKISHFLDIFMFVYLHHHEFDVQKLKRYINDLKAEKYVCWCMQVTSLVFESDVLEELLRVLNYPIGAVDDSYGLLETHRKKWCIPLNERIFSNNWIEKFVDSLDVQEKREIDNNLNYSYLIKERRLNR